MKNKKGNVTVIAIIILLVAISASLITYLVTIRLRPSIEKEVVNQSTAPIQQPQSILNDNQITPQSQTPSEDNSSYFYPEWKVYQNEKYGFSVRYPENWKIYIEDSASVALGPINGQDSSIMFAASEKINDEKILPYFAIPERNIYDRKNTKINDVDWEVLTLEGQIGYITHRNGITYAAQTSWCENRASEILMTFRFTR